MSKCEWCNKRFDKDEAELYFDSETFLLSYNHVRKCLCGECAVKAITEDLVDGVYYETCENCGIEFDLIEEEGRFDNQVDGIDLRDAWRSSGKILCADCAIKEI